MGKITKEQLENRVKEIATEYRNYRNRTTKEKEELKQNGCKSLLTAILPAIDDLERSLVNSNGDADTFKKGVFLSYVNLIKALQTQGVEIMKTDKQQFNPDLHEAIGVTTEGNDGDIHKCIRHGYILNGEVVRHAQVIVTQNQQ